MEERKFFNAYTLGLFLIIAISIATHWQWFIPHGILTASDWWYLPNDVLKEYLTAPKILEGSIDFNPGRLTPTFDLIRVIGGFISFFVHGFPLWERLFFLWPIALLGPIPIYALLYKRFGSSLGAIAGSLIYTFNSYILAREISHIHIAIAYLLLIPTILYALDALLTRPSMRTSAIFTFITILFSIYEIRVLYITTGILIAYLIAKYLTKSATASYRTFAMMQLSAIIIVLAQSFWLIPFIFAPSSLGYATFTQRALFQSFTKLEHASTLTDPSWTGNGFLPFTTQPVMLLSYAIPILAVLWIIVKPRNERTNDLWFWLMIGLGGIFLSQGQNMPFRGVYQWLFENVPGFRLFRDSSKFNVVTSIAYAFLIGASVTYIQKRRVLFSLTALACIGAIVGINVYPFISSQIHDLTTPYTLPKEYQEITKILQDNSTFSRSLWIPAPQRFVYFSETHPRVDAGTVLNQEWKPFIKDPSDVYSFFTQPNAKALLNFGSIKYIGVPSDTTHDIYQWFPRTKKAFASLINPIPGLQPINKSDAAIPLWENKDAKDRIYIANDVTLVDSSALEFSNLDTNKTGAFIFRPDIPGYLFSLLTQTLATNQEAKPFNLENLHIENNSVTTKLQLVPNSKLKTTTREVTNDIISEIYAQRTDETVSLYYKLDEKNASIGTFKSVSDTFLVYINGKAFPAFTPTNDEKAIGVARLQQTGNRAELYSRTETGNTLIQDPSFENSIPGEVGDCANEDSSPLESNGIEANLVPDATNGTQGLALSAKKHLGCIFFPIQHSKNATLYSLTFDHKTKSGDSGSIKILDETAPGAQLAAQELERGTNWHTSTSTFQTPSTFKNKLTAYIYQPGSTGEDGPATTVFDNIQIDAYQLLGETVFASEAPQQKGLSTKDFEKADAFITPKHPYTPEEIVLDGEFENGITYTAGDCNNSDKTLPAKNGIAAQIIQENSNHALSIKAAQHLACVGMILSSLDPVFDHFISMRYKNTQGTPPSIALYSPDGKSVAPIVLPEQNDSAWHEFRTIIRANEAAPNSTLMLYVSAENHASEAAFDDIHIVPIPILPDISITSANKPLPQTKTQVQTINPLVHTIKSEAIDRHRLLLLSSRYDQGWKLFVRPQGAPRLSWWRRILRTPPGVEISAQTHIKANAFVNGWVLDPVEIETALGNQALPEFIIEYWPQRFMDAGRTISLTVLFAYFGGVALILLGKKIPYRKGTGSNKDTKSHV
ncbi:MAG: hypothetical protein A3C02_00965 [Candidatus Andersenbacteria bacterium RIFCSPHIGHO2_02_FULL_45_11]|uniref:Uncharacterized protein n=1 Tax=Candidatus Andersenbacteria bacterium RIFCSPHIGHO2_12_FULL_45_11 TaxID=1797281 RepID=A0A1G1WZE0_9BACT|nr:MAG: hypothetical protein A2805_00540 [Candidatus Andersenbacteria bacterium RIFCSPHIGHO2_01_FULL_46_36]OGY33122.1 MAG: hypothetical protein A3D99_01535 [Candidatus Andersenbacteria bacterium RIFCSPHIGHO2_12_FULL_45_11]OGY33147.1 MAG: hypothetical protein A3C02_00965 [Candidatus Andersenbacteria bacterium RIFCSPHIGHO2_02_FULL_45_11]